MHHWENVVLHALAAVALFAALRRATRALWPSGFVALVFALHPLHVESVAWISERKDVLSPFFWFLAAYAYVRFAEQPGLRRYLLVLALFCLGLMFKPMLVTFRFTCLLLDVWPLRRTQFPWTLCTWCSVRPERCERGGWGIASGARLISYAGYIWKTSWPVGLTLLYPCRTWATDWHAAGALLVILSVSAAAIWTWRTRPYFATGWFWYLGTRPGYRAGAGGNPIARRPVYVRPDGLTSRDPVMGDGRCSQEVAAGKSRHRIRGRRVIYQRAIKVTENRLRKPQPSSKLHYPAGRLSPRLTSIPASSTPRNPDRVADAVTQYEAALRCEPDFAQGYKNLGIRFLRLGRRSEAIAHFQAELRIAPDRDIAQILNALLPRPRWGHFLHKPFTCNQAPATVSIGDGSFIVR